MIVRRESSIAPQFFALIVRINTIRQVIDTVNGRRKPELAQIAHVRRSDVDAERPYATVHRHQEEIVLMTRAG